MKALQLITTGMIITFSMTALSETKLPNEKLSIEIIEVLNPTCNSSFNGKITVEPIGGEAPYTYNWNTFPNQSTATANNLSSGIYFVEVKDADGNVYFESIELTAPESLNAEENTASLSSDETVVDLEFSMIGGNSPYTYEFNGQYLDSPEVNNLTVGIHTMVITDANDCSMIQYIQVFEIEEENEEGDLLGWTLFNQAPQNEIQITRVEFSELTPYENESTINEELVLTNE